MTTPFKEELELDQLREVELDLFKRAREVEEHQKRMEMDRAERESTIPPPDDIESRKRMLDHELAITRGAVKNKLKEQNRSLLLLIMLVAATSALIWWGWTMMQGT